MDNNKTLSFKSVEGLALAYQSVYDTDDKIAHYLSENKIKVDEFKLGFYKDHVCIACKKLNKATMLWDDFNHDITYQEFQNIIDSKFKTYTQAINL
ncbi:hypothetical protein [Cysteiniphilum marinum]|uniref:hypothetical protein n=1 Tax=Cysteiniphilum marinum TaxID=2774191 RepID=UPI00193AB7D5|nr:hypothetical protein [Cysteiniphilum marinum]